MLEKYQTKRDTVANYSIDDHPHLSTPKIHEIYVEFRKAVLALDPCVTEEFMKYYVAFKAETNFVDAVPQARALRLSLNMKFSEINDVRGICRDITNIGRWGNGDVELKLASVEEIPYVMGLVRQSIELQLDGAEA